MQKALSKKSQKKAAQKKVAQKKVAQRHSGKKREDVIILNNVWKIFGLAADEAMQAVQERGLGKSEVLSEFGCVVGLAFGVGPACFLGAPPCTCCQRY